MIPENNPEHAEALNLDDAIVKLASQHQMLGAQQRRVYIPQDNGDLMVRTVLFTTMRQLTIDACLRMGHPDA